VRTHVRHSLKAGAAFAVALFLLGSASLALGQQQQGRRSRGLSPERQQEMIQRYPGIDANGDGVLSSDEVRAFFRNRQNAGPDGGSGRGPDRQSGDAGSSRGGRHDHGPFGRRDDFRRRSEEFLKEHPEADKNGDGRLSPDEAREYFQANPQALQQDMLRRHPELDTNKDGQLSDDELAAARSSFDERRRADTLRRFPQADKDGDGKLSDEEMQAVREQFAERWRQEMLQRHPEADTDGDGKLSDAEMNALREQFRSRFGRGADGRPGGAPDAAAAPAPAVGADSHGDRERERARRDARPSQLGREKADPWVQYVEKFSEQYRLDASQRATAQSILRDYVARRAKLLQEAQPAAGESGDAAKSKESRKAIDSLFKEMKERLDQIPTSSQRSATSSKPA